MDQSGACCIRTKKSINPYVGINGDFAVTSMNRNGMGSKTEGAPEGATDFSTRLI